MTIQLIFKKFLFILFGFSLLLQPVLAAVISVSPKEDTSLIQITGVGWQTVSAYGEKNVWQHCGDTAGGKYELCGTAVETKALIGSGIPSGSAYYRWMWKEVEPENGNINFAMIDKVLANANSMGQTLEFRIMLELQQNAVPQWAIDAGVPMRNRDATCLHGFQSPDYNNPITKQLVFRLMRALGNRYNDHPGIGTVEVGLLGLWGEGHIYCNTTLNPTFETKKEYVDSVYKFFPNTPILIGVDFGPKYVGDRTDDIVSYCVDKGRCGWRADSWGHWGAPLGPKMQEYNWQLSKHPNLWQKGPIALEKGKLMFDDSDFTTPNLIDTTFAMSLTWGTSLASNWGRIPWIGPDPSEKQKLVKLKKFLKKIGFRFVLQKATYETAVKAGDSIPISMDWVNRGIAPPYRDLRVAFRLRGAQGNISDPVITNLSVKLWLPGNKTAISNFKIPANLSSGSYTLETALVHHSSANFVTAIAIDGKTTDGWYPLGNMSVTGNTGISIKDKKNLFSKYYAISRSRFGATITPTRSDMENKKFNIYSARGNAIAKIGETFNVQQSGIYIVTYDGIEIERFVVLK